ncbi:MAG: hypothetical protein NDJ75_11300, partial [Thermoanaerobaculia bacterium]|nr:hypothetical protein [Thermoanaerobaculia bacterium]
AGRWRPALAAAAVLALGAAVLWLRSAPRDAAAVLAELGAEPQTLARLGAGWTEPLWSVTRGDGPVVSERARAFRLGARSADLDLALAAGDRDAARRLAAECAALVGDVPLADPVAHLYRELARRAGDAAAPLPPLATDAATAARLTREAVDPALWELGRWGEAGRLAAAAGAPPGAPALPRDAAVPAELADPLRHAARPELDATPAQRAAAFAALVARGGDLR